MTSHMCACWPKQPLFALIVKCSLLLVFCAVATYVVLPIACSKNSRCSSQLTGSNISITLSNHGAASLSAALAKFVTSAEVLTSPTGLEDFAAFGDAVRAVAKLWNMQMRADMDPQRPVSAKIIRHQLNAALQHLFPFLSSQSRQAFTKSQETETDSKGIVIPCGNHDFQFTLHLIAAVRNIFSSSLPIEVMFAGESDLDIAKQEAIESLGEHIKTIDILHVSDENIVGLQGGGWAIKPFAILASSFQQVIMADADAVFLQSPEAAFEAPGYQETGTLFFHDRMFDFPGSTPGDNDRHRWWNGVMDGRVPSVNLQNSGFWSNQSIHEMESGVVVINKGNKQALLGLLFAAWMNTKTVREAITYKYTHGDKESFWMSCELATIPYYFSGGYASAIGHVTHDALRGRMLCEVPMHLLHLDHRGKPFWFNGSLYRDKNAQKKVWLNPQLWAADTGQWDLDCLLNIDAHGGVHDLSEDGYVKVYQDMVQEAKGTNAAFDSLI